MEGAAGSRRLRGNIDEYMFDLTAVGVGVVRNAVMREPKALLVDNTERPGPRGAPAR